MNDDKLKIVETVNDISLAEILKGLIESHEIEVFISREGYESAIGLTGLPSTFIDILVPSGKYDQAKKITEGYFNGDFSED